MSPLRRAARRLLPSAVLATLISCAPPPAEVGSAPADEEPTADQPTVTPPIPAPAVRADEDLAAELAQGKPVRVIVMLDTTRVDATRNSTSALAPPDAARRAIRFAALKHDLFANAPSSLVVDADYEQLPLAAATLTSPDALAHLLSDPSVARVVPDQLNTVSLAQSLALISQPAALAEGKDGTGTAVAVLDTGADYRVADLGSCTAPGTPASCRVAWAQDFAAQDNLLDDSGKHGTNVSSIVAAVAPGTKIIALDVFDGASGYDSVIINAINWVVANRATYNIVAMNLSLGGGSYTAPCDGSALATAINEARNVGVLAAIATGNSAKTNALSSPACASGAISVGAVYDSNVGPLNSAVCSDATTAADKVTCFSNSASFMTMLAPGAFITAGGVSMAGTSQATPHVAGALAVLRGAFPTETASDVVARLTTTGASITDPRNGVVKPRLNLQAAAAGCVFKLTPASRTITSADSTFDLTLTTTSSCDWTLSSDVAWLSASPTSGTGSATLTLHANVNTGAVRTGSVTVTGSSASATATVTQGVDTTPPTGSVLINDGAALTRTQTVALTIAASDPSGVTSMCVSNGTTCTTFEPFATSRVWTLATTQGLQTVRVFLRDAQGNTTSTSSPSDTITLDTVAPTGGTLTAAPGIASATLTWTAATDATSGVDKYRVVFAPTTAPATCASGTVAYEGSALSFTHTGLTNGTLYGWRVCALDKAGNVAAGVTASATPRPEFNGPVGAFTINGGAAYTKSTAVTLTLTPTDESTVTEVCLTATLPCTTWQAFAATKSFTLPAIEGARTVYALFKDQWTNVSTTAASASIVLDTVQPTLNTATSSYGNASATLTWTAATDATSGMGTYRVVFAANTAPASCAVGTVAYEGSALTYTHTGLTNGTLYAWRVCAIDRAGNLNAGVTTSTQPRPESDGPVAAFTINGGATFTKSTAVTLSLTPTDASTVSQMCLSAALPCTAWQPHAATKTFSLATPDGTKTVYALFKDVWNNVSAAAAQQSIVLDTTLPTTDTASSVYGNASVTLSWTASTDATSGLDKYRVVFATGVTPPANCATGTVAYEGTALTFTHSSLTNGTTYSYRVCALDRAGNLGLGAVTAAQPRPEADGPVAAFSINGGAAYTKSASVTLTLSPTDASTVSQVCVSSALPCAAWQAYASTMTFALPAPDGTKTVYASFKDVWNNVSTTAAQRSIVLDTTLPTTGTASSVYGNASVTLSWTASTDATSGLDKYRVVFATGVTPPANCATGTVAYEGTALTFTHSALTNGTTYSYRVCALDKAGNLGLGAVTSAQPRPESDGPIAAFTINGGAAYTKSASVTLTLSPTDASTVSQVCISSTLPCTAWQAHAATKPWSLATPDGAKTVYVLFKDVWNNVSAAAAQQSIVLDLTLPTETTLTATPGASQVALSWTASADGTSGVAGYKVVAALGSTPPPAQCTSGTVLADGTARTFTHTGLSSGATWSYRVCARDNAGNITAGATAIAKAP